jgi:hypothetical protein
MNSSRLGSSPLGQSIFSRTEPETINQNPETEILKQETGNQNLESENKKPENGNQKMETVILKPEIQYDKVTVRLPIEQNDWLDEFSRKTKRLHGSKISKEDLVQIALEILKYQNIDPAEVINLDSLKNILKEKNLLEN